MSIWVPSPNYHHGRRKALTWIVWHSTESGEVRGGAMNVAAGWFGKRASGVSAHIVVDDGADRRYPDGVVECVRPGDTAWHAASANAGGYGIEVVGKAGQGGPAWSDPYSLAAVKNACLWILSNPSLQNIPSRWLTDTQLRNGERGHIVHSQVSRVLGGTTHTDPGAGFPYAFAMEQLGARSASTTPAASSVGGTGRTLRVVAPLLSGDDVRALQAGLNRVFPSYSHLTVDGSYGPGTAAVVREFQQRSGLSADGVVGPATRSALAKAGI
jgi:N-acetyl-anhydromuramyl-L-alanine amidase AmpD